MGRFTYLSYDAEEEGGRCVVRYALTFFDKKNNKCVFGWAREI
jgi:hypothetical protein